MWISKSKLKQMLDKQYDKGVGVGYSLGYTMGKIDQRNKEYLHLQNSSLTLVDVLEEVNQILQGNNEKI